MLAIRAHSRSAPWQFFRHVAPRAAFPFVQTFGNPLRHALRNPLQMRQVYTGPFVGPPSYATIIRRFSLQPNPVTFFSDKKAQETVERGEFDIHDIGGVDPKDFDILLTDLSDNTLRSEIADIVGIPYLQEATEDEANEVVKAGQAFIYGTKFRTIFPCVVGRKGKAHWVFFVVDTGAPLTYLSKQAAQVLGIDVDPNVVTIAGHPYPVHISPKSSHFSDVNILGADFCTLNNIFLSPPGTRKLTLYFGDEWVWDVKPKL